MRIEHKKIPATMETVFIAEDGTEFLSANKCEKYEREMKIYEMEAKVRQFQIEGVIFPFEEEETDNVIKWYKLKSTDDFNLIKSYYELFVNYGYFDEPSEYPAIVFVEESADDYSYAYMNGDVNVVICETQIAFAKLGYTVEFKRKW